MSAGETKDREWRGYLVYLDFFAFREFPGRSEDLSKQLSRSEFCLYPYVFVNFDKEQRLNN
jgi:hypothetical protein